MLSERSKTVRIFMRMPLVIYSQRWLFALIPTAAEFFGRIEWLNKLVEFAEDSPHPMRLIGIRKSSSARACGFQMSV